MTQDTVCMNTFYVWKPMLLKVFITPVSTHTVRNTAESVHLKMHALNYISTHANEA